MLCVYTHLMPILSELIAQIRSDDKYGLALHNSNNTYDLMFALVQARKDAGLKQPEVAERMGVSQQAISKIEDMDGDPKLSTVRRYATAIGVGLDLSLDAKNGWLQAASPVRAPHERGSDIHDILQSVAETRNSVVHSSTHMPVARTNYRNDFGLAG